MTVYPGGAQDSIKYTATAPDGSVATFNDPSDANYVGMAYFSGLDGSDIREAINPRAGADGGVQGLNYRAPRTIVGTVEIVAASTVDRNQKQQKLRRAMNATVADGTLAFTPDGGLPSQVKYRLNGRLARADERGWKYTYQFPLTCADPYIQSQTQHVTTLPSGTVQATVTNQGDGPSYPVFTLTLPTGITTITVTNQTTSEKLQLFDLDSATLFGSELLSFGGPGIANNQFSTPEGLAVDSAGNVWIADEGNNRVQKWSPSGVHQANYGTYGTGNGQFNGPFDIAFDSLGNFYVTDTFNNRVQKFNSAGVYQSQFGTAGSGNGQFNHPVGISLDSAGNIFVTDNGNSRVQKFTSAGVYSSQFGAAGSGAGQFSSPMGCVHDSLDNIWICDYGNNRFQKWNSAGVFQNFYGVTGSFNGQFNGPSWIARDSANNLYVTDANNKRVQKFDSSGAYKAQYAIGTPTGIALLASTTVPLYVVDGDATVVQKIDTGTQTLVADFSVSTLTAGGVNLYAYVDVPNTKWWALVPGDNSVQANGNAGWSVAWRDSWL